MVSRVPATLATCPCHSPETPSGPCSPISVPVQAPPPCGRLAPCLHPFWIRRHLLGCLRATGALGSPQSSPLCLLTPTPTQAHPQGWPLPGVLQGPSLLAPALKRIRFTRGWLLWSLKSWHFNISFLGSSMTLHLGIMLGGGPLTQCKRVTCEGKIGEGSHNSPYFPFHALCPRQLPFEGLL